MINIVEVLKTLCEKILYLNKELVSETTFQSICSAEKLVSIDDDGTNGSFYRIGNILRGYFSAPSVGLGAGNITNTDVANMYIQINENTRPFFRNINRNSFISGGSGGVCTLIIDDSRASYAPFNINGTIYEDILHFQITATATHAAIPGTLSSFYYTTVNFNTNYFDDKE